MRFFRKFKYLLTFILVVVLCIVGVIYKDRLIKDSNTKVIMDDVKIKNDVDGFDTIKVDIKGAVNNPGVYEVGEATIINDLIDLAGGLKEDADTSVINLAKKLENEDLIIIYTKEEVKNSNIVDTVVKEVMGECVCPNIQNDGCINEEIDDTISNFDIDKENDFVKDNSNDLVNINTASKEELMEISGIGEAKAAAIVEYRKKNKFESIEDIMNVSGIGQALYEKIKEYIKV